MSRGNILLIDDDDKLRHLLKRIISLEGFVVYEAVGKLKSINCLNRRTQK